MNPPILFEQASHDCLVLLSVPQSSLSNFGGEYRTSAWERSKGGDWIAIIEFVVASMP